MDQMNGMMSVFTVLIGLLAFYAAFTGKGPVFKNEYPKAMKADADAMLRKFCWYIGPVATITGGLDYFWASIIGAEAIKSAPFIWSAFPFLLGVVLIIPAIVLYVIQFRKRFKQYLSKL